MSTTNTPMHDFHTVYTCENILLQATLPSYHIIITFIALHQPGFRARDEARTPVDNTLYRH